MDLKIKKVGKLESIIFGGITFVISLYLFPFYISGDQEHYRLFYDNISNYSFFNGFIAYRSYLGANEPVYYFIVYVLNTFLDKDILFSLINAVFGFFLSYTLINLRVNKIIVFSTLFNFYFLVLLFSAERLKVSMMFFLIAVNQSSNFKQYFYLFLSILSHVQSLMVVYVFKFAQLKSEFKKIIKKGNIFGILLLIAVFLGLVGILFYMRGYLTDKYIAYENKSGIINILKPLLFCFLTISYCKKKWFDILILFIPLIILSILIGEERIVIFCYSIFMYYAIQKNKGINIGVLVTNIYFLYKGVEFILNILNNGNGFDNT